MQNILKKISDKFPFLFIDAGAMGGAALKRWKALTPIMKVYAFEPDTREFCKLRDSKKIRYLDYILFSESKDLTFYIAKDAGKSSIFEPNMEFLTQYEDYERFNIIDKKLISADKVKTLDAIIRENSIPDIDFLKLDTQGSELHVLQGALQECIPKIFGLQIEVEFVELYKNQPLFKEVDEFLQDNGFQLIDLRRVYWKRKDFYDYIGKGELIFADALYFKKIAKFRQQLLFNKESIGGKSKIIKSILISLVYGIYDYAVSLANIGLESGYLDKNEHKEIIILIKRCSPHSYLKKTVAFKILYKIGYALLQKNKPYSYLGWADSDNEIGNSKTD
jgi:FkbM family methyltransferase